MNVNKLYDDVYEVNDFLTNSEFAAVLSVINGLTEDDWFSKDTAQDKDFADFWYGKNLEFKTENIFTDINKKMESLFESYHYYPSNLLLQRYKKGDFIQPHTDQWNPDLPYYVGYGFCLYYNDDYQGGELDYPELGITVKPKANSLYIHGGHIMHGSKPVLDDKIRYFSTVFIRGTKEEPTRLKGDIFK